MMSTFLQASWLNLVFANYPVPVRTLEKHLPAGTEPDSFNGVTYVSLVGFLFADTKLKGFSVPCHQTFEEINFRFYVRRKSGPSWRRGVVFIREIVPKPMVTLIANRLYRERYTTLPTRHRCDVSAQHATISYEWKHKGSWNSIQVSRENTGREIPAGSEEEFLTKQHWGYTRLNNSRTIEYGVTHRDWKLYDVPDFEINCDFGGLYGDDFADLSSARPHSVLAADGSAITISAKHIFSASDADSG